MTEKEILTLIHASEVRKLARQMRNEDLAAYSDDFDTRHARTGPNGEHWKPDYKVKEIAIRDWERQQANQIDAYLRKAALELERISKIIGS